MGLNKVYACLVHSRFYFQNLYLDFAISRRHCTDSATSYFRQGFFFYCSNTLHKKLYLPITSKLIKLIMPNIVNEIKLDFKDVMLRPKRSTLKSRNDVSIDPE